MKRLALLILALLLLVSTAGAEEVWEKSLGEEITAVATDEYGDRIFVGTTSGMLYCYDASGSVVWSKQITTLNGNCAIEEITANGNGDSVLIRTNSTGKYSGLYNGGSGALIWPAQAGSSIPGDIDLSQSGEISLTTYTPGIADIFDIAGKRIFRGAISPISKGAIAGDADWVVFVSGSNLLLYDLNVPPANWLPPTAVFGWQKRAAHTLTGTTAALTNYPVEITVIRGAGSSAGSTLYAPDCRADFADIRFTAADGVTQIPYYLESVVGSTATFLVNVPSIPASPGTTTIYVYWLNPGETTTTSDPDAARYTLDDFSGTSLNTDIWETFGTATITVADGKLTITGDNIGYSGVRSKGMYTGDNDTIEVNANVEGTLGDNGAFWIGFFGDGQVPNSINAELAVTLKRATFTSWNSPQQLHGSTADGSARANYLFGARLTGYNDYRVEWNGTSADMQAGAYGEQTLASAPTTNCTIMLAIGDTSASYGGVTMTVDEVTIVSPVNIPALHGAWSSVESIVTLLDTETLTGTIVDVDAPETGDWVAVSTDSKTYIIQITDTGFGTIYNDDRVGTAYEVAVADGGSFVIEGRAILADIFRIDATQVGTYTTGGPVQHVALAQKNGLYAAAGSDDGKYYVFSKDATSTWYLLYGSDSYDPVTALAMSWRGEYTVIGRSDGRLVVFQASEDDTDGVLRITVFKENAPYTNQTLYVEDGGMDQEWGAPAQVITDDYGVAAVPVTWGHYTRITVGDGELVKVIVASAAQTSYVFRVPGAVPLRTGAQFGSSYDSATQRIYLSYDDTRDTTHLVVYEIARVSDGTVIYSEEFTEFPVSDYYQIPAGWTNTSYRVSLTASGSPSFTNTWSQWVGTAGVATPPGELDNFMKMGISFFLILFVAGLFSYLSGPQGAVVVSLLAGALVLWGWLPIAPTIVALCIVWAFLGLLGRTAGEG
ncbi:MAG: DUF2341 domain-containing protein [Bacilli bacterium]|jgi:hypothetical protein